MKLPGNFKPHLVASQDETRYALCRVAIEGNLAVATNGRAMVVGVISDEDTDTRTWGHVSNDAMKEITKKRLGGMLTGQFTFKADTVEVLTDMERTAIHREPSFANFPNWDHEGILQSDFSQSFSVALSMKWLKPLAEALGEDDICLTFNVDRSEWFNKGGIVVTTKHDDRFGIIMPVHPGEVMHISKNKAYWTAVSGAEDRQKRRAVGALEMQARHAPLAEAVKELPGIEKAAVVWANRHGIKGDRQQLLAMFEDARNTVTEGGDAQ